MSTLGTGGERAVDDLRVEHQREGTPVDPDTLNADWAAIQDSPDFQLLKRRFRAFAFPATVIFLGWYLLYIFASIYARGFLDNKVIGNINIAYIFGLLQFASTFIIAGLYARHASRNLDPVATKIRTEIEGGVR